jgi:hypothetical protein
LRIFPLYYGLLALLFFVTPLIPLLQGSTLDYLVNRQRERLHSALGVLSGSNQAL